MKKSTILAICLALLLSTAACSNNNNKDENSDTSSQTEESSVASEESVSDAESEPEMEGDLMQGDENQVRDDNIEMTLTLDNDTNTYTHNDVINATVTIKNIGDVPVAYVHGSGSFTVPQALSFGMNDFVNLYTPGMQTNDYRTHVLEPGDSLEFKCPFVPYSPANEEVANNIVDMEADIDFFKSDDYLPAQAGTVDGKITFTYYVGNEMDSQARTDADASDDDMSGSETGNAVEDAMDDVREGVDEVADGITDAVEDMVPGGMNMVDEGEEKQLVLDFTFDISEGE